MEDLLDIDRISVQVGLRLISLVDPNKESTIFDRIGALRRRFAQELGIIVPLVNTAQNAADVVRWAKYSPVGSRGVGLARAQGYGAGFAEYVQRANDEIAVIVQAEHAQAVENIESIVAVDGIDAIQLGPYDLSASMGKLGQITDPEVVAAITRIYSACQQANVRVGSFGITAAAVQADIQRGATMICAGTDSLFLGQAASNMLAAIKPVA